MASSMNSKKWYRWACCPCVSFATSEENLGYCRILEISLPSRCLPDTCNNFEPMHGNAPGFLCRPGVYLNAVFSWAGQETEMPDADLQNVRRFLSFLRCLKYGKLTLNQFSPKAGDVKKILSWCRARNYEKYWCRTLASRREIWVAKWNKLVTTFIVRCFCDCIRRSFRPCDVYVTSLLVPEHTRSFLSS